MCGRRGPPTSARRRDRGAPAHASPFETAYCCAPPPTPGTRCSVSPPSMYSPPAVCSSPPRPQSSLPVPALWPRRRRGPPTQHSSPPSSGDRSAPFAVAAPSQPSACRPSRTCSISESPTAACGRPPTMVARGTRCSTSSRRVPSARWKWRPPTRTSCMSGPAKGCSGPISPPVTGCTSPPTPAGRGRTWACATAGRSRESPSIRTTPTGCSWPCSAILTDPTASAAFSARRTADGRSSACCTRTRTPAASTCSSRPTIRTRSTPPFGRRDRDRGRMACSRGPARGCSSRLTAEPPGSR